MRRRLLRLLLTLAAALPLAGCLTAKETLVLAADGSGSVSLSYEFDPGALAALLQRVRAHFGAAEPAHPAPEDTANPVAPAWLEAAAREGKGYTLTKTGASIFVDGRAMVRVEGSGTFTSLEAAARGGCFHGAFVALERLPKHFWRFVVRDPWTPLGPGSPDVFGGIDGAQVKREFGPDLAALAHTLVVTFPVAVASTNGTLSPDRRTVTWTTRGDEPAPHALTAEFTLPEGVDWPTFRHVPDLAALARRCTQAPPEQAKPPRRE